MKKLTPLAEKLTLALNKPLNQIMIYAHRRILVKETCKEIRQKELKKLWHIETNILIDKTQIISNYMKHLIEEK